MGESFHLRFGQGLALKGCASLFVTVRRPPILADALVRDVKGKVTDEAFITNKR